MRSFIIVCISLLLTACGGEGKTVATDKLTKVEVEDRLIRMSHDGSFDDCKDGVYLLDSELEELSSKLSWIDTVESTVGLTDTNTRIHLGKQRMHAAQGHSQQLGQFRRLIAKRCPAAAGLMRILEGDIEHFPQTLEALAACREIYTWLGEDEKASLNSEQHITDFETFDMMRIQSRTCPERIWEAAQNEGIMSRSARSDDSQPIGNTTTSSSLLPTTNMADSAALRSDEEIDRETTEAQAQLADFYATQSGDGSAKASSPATSARQASGRVSSPSYVSRQTSTVPEVASAQEIARCREIVREVEGLRDDWKDLAFSAQLHPDYNILRPRVENLNAQISAAKSELQRMRPDMCSVRGPNIVASLRSSFDRIGL